MQSGARNEVDELHSLRREIEFKKGKVRILLREWNECWRNAIDMKPYDIDFHNTLTVNDEEHLQNGIKKALDGDELRPIERQAILKVIGPLIEGSILSFTALADLVSEKLKTFGIIAGPEEGDIGMSLVDTFAQKCTILSEQPPPQVSVPETTICFELKSLEPFRGDKSLGVLAERQAQRRIYIQWIKALSQHLHVLSEAEISKEDLARIDESEAKYNQAKAKFQSELLRLEREKNDPRPPENDQPKPKVLAKSRVGTTPHTPAANTQVEQSTDKFSVPASQVNPNNSAVLTTFFRLKPINTHKKLEEEIPPVLNLASSSSNLFKRSLGSLPRFSEWTHDRIDAFDRLCRQQFHTVSMKHNSLNLLNELKLKFGKYRDMKKMNRMSAPGILKVTSPVIGNSNMASQSQGVIDHRFSLPNFEAEEKNSVPRRYVYLKLEDHLLQSRTYNGLFPSKHRSSHKSIKNDLDKQTSIIDETTPVSQNNVREDEPSSESFIKRSQIQTQEDLNSSISQLDLRSRFASLRNLRIQPLNRLPPSIVEYSPSVSSDEGSSQEPGESINSSASSQGESPEEGAPDLDDFVVPDGFQSDSEDDNQSVKNKRKADQEKNKRRNLKELKVEVWEGETATEAEKDGWKIFPLNSLIDPKFPIETGSLTAEEINGVEAEIWRELLKEVHCSVSKKKWDKVFDRYNLSNHRFKHMPKQMLKSKIEDVTTLCYIVDPEVYENNVFTELHRTRTFKATFKTSGECPWQQTHWSFLQRCNQLFLIICFWHWGG
jgi:hypothetical protein